jgi:arginine/lysine/ornithine decarboxylase
VKDIRDCFSSEIELIPVDDSAVGRISCEIRYECPPGFPVLLYGERIQKAQVEVLGALGVSHIKAIKE